VSSVHHFGQLLAGAQRFDGIHALGHIDHLAANDPLRRIVEQIAVGDLEPNLLTVSCKILMFGPAALMLGPAA
jgi:hypothetical protein